LSFAFAPNEFRPGDRTPWGTHVPTMYRPHASLETTVTQNGRGLGFVVGQVAPDRRWAIGPDGELVDQTTFSEQIRLVWDEQYRINGAMPSTHDGNPVPRVEQYVSWTQDAVRPDRLAPLDRPRLVLTAPGKPDTSPIVDTKALAAQGFAPVPAKEEPQAETAAARAAKPARKGMSLEAREAARARMKARHEAKRAAQAATE
jgi:FtsP/CotA-like multicopper oxidase with cupredoxin domain